MQITTIGALPGATTACMLTSSNRVSRCKRIDANHGDRSLTIDKLLAEIETSEPGPGTAALFDFDGTIIAGYSATVFLQDAITSGDLSLDELLQMIRALANFGLGNMGFSALMAVHAQYLAGQSEADYAANAERLFKRKIARLIYPETRRLIEAHRAKGHTLGIISSATPYQVEPSARDLGIDRVYTTGLEVEDGVFTGAVKKPTVFGEGKVLAAETLAADSGADLNKSFFYTDSIDDLQLLERVGKPVTLNPRKSLQTLTRERHWPTASFDSRGKVSVNRFLRSIAATSSLVGSFAAGVPIYALTGSKRDSVNFSISLFADTCNAIIGLDLDVHGEEHLWSHRPAVFMFNHQSKADVAIMASLVRRDVVAVGKKEIKRMPVIGQVMGYAGTVFIDRSDREKAIESMKPLVKAMREQRKSLVIAPEGTRTPTPALAPFKRGGFHIAMQVGVPIVPIVIHNAGDIAPKGDFLFRPGKVRVDVLPPIDTRDWTVTNLHDHVAEVRNQFLVTLGQTETPTRTARKKQTSTAETAATNTDTSSVKKRQQQSKTGTSTVSTRKNTAKTAPKAPKSQLSKVAKQAGTKTKTAEKITTPAKRTTAKSSGKRSSAVRPKLATKG